MVRTVPPTPLLVAVDLGGSFTLPAGQGLNIAAFKSFSAALVWTGAPVGDYQPQASHDGVTWFDRGSPVAAGIHAS